MKKSLLLCVIFISITMTPCVSMANISAHQESLREKISSIVYQGNTYDIDDTVGDNIFCQLVVLNSLSGLTEVRFWIDDSYIMSVYAYPQNLIETSRKLYDFAIESSHVRDEPLKSLLDQWLAEDLMSIAPYIDSITGTKSIETYDGLTFIRVASWDIYSKEYGLLPGVTFQSLEEAIATISYHLYQMKLWHKEHPNGYIGVYIAIAPSDIVCGASSNYAILSLIDKDIIYPTIGVLLSDNVNSITKAHLWAYQISDALDISIYGKRGEN